MRRPRVRNAVSRRCWTIVSVDHSISSKISASGMKVIVVPLVELSAVPADSSMSP